VCLQEVQANQLQTFYHQLNYLGKISVTFLVPRRCYSPHNDAGLFGTCPLFTPLNCTICMNLRVVTKLEILYTYLALPPTPPRAMLVVAYATGRASHARQVKGDDPDKKGHPGPPGWALGVRLTTSPLTKNIVT